MRTRSNIYGPELEDRQDGTRACGEAITLDLAAAEWNHKCERYFTKEDDALKQEWNARAAWCNPPYSAAIIELFVRKAMDAAQHGTTTYCLLPWWNYPYLDLCEQHGRIHRICSPVSFRRQDGTAFAMNNHYSTTQLVVVVFGPTVRPGFGMPIRKEDAGSALPTSNDVGGGEEAEAGEPLGDEGKQLSPLSRSDVPSPPTTTCRNSDVWDLDDLSEPLDSQVDGDEGPATGNGEADTSDGQPRDNGNAKADRPTQDLQNTETPPSLCQWIFERLTDAGVFPKTILDPCAGRGNLTRPFRPQSDVIEYEISLGRDFFQAAEVACDLVICNPPWSQAEQWLRHIVAVVGNRKPLVFICPALLLHGDKNGAFRRYLESDGAPVLNHTTILPRGTFVKVYCPAVICWFNIPGMRDVALVPGRYLIRKLMSIEPPAMEAQGGSPEPQPKKAEMATVVIVDPPPTEVVHPR